MKPTPHTITHLPWKSAPRWRFPLPQGLETFIKHPGSSTTYCQHHFGETAQINQIETLITPPPSALCLAWNWPTQPQPHRQVLLTLDHKPWMVAQSWLHPDTHPNHQKTFQSLGKRLLGPWLFELPQLQRSTYRWAEAHADLRWGRSSCCSCPGLSVLLVEWMMDHPCWHRDTENNTND